MSAAVLASVAAGFVRGASGTRPQGELGQHGALRMATICAELEDAGRSRELENAAALAERLEAEYGRVRSALEAELQRS